MNPTAPLSRQCARLLRLGLIALSFAFAFPVQASDSDEKPPVFADTVHVQNGCYLSTARYLAGFRASFPAERGDNVTVEPRGFAGKHTIALVTWRGGWWGRDEYFGVFSLGLPVAGNPDPHALADFATRRFVKHARREVNARRAQYASDSPPALTTSEVIRFVRLASAITTTPGEVFWARSGIDAVPFLFFRPAAGLVAVYNPNHGTATAETTLSDAAHIVGLVAAKLGYSVIGVSRDPVGGPSGYASLCFPPPTNDTLPQGRR